MTLRSGAHELGEAGFLADSPAYKRGVISCQSAVGLNI